jgi:hypothetical protein
MKNRDSTTATTTCSAMNNFRDETDDEVAALTRGASMGWDNAIYNGTNSHQNGSHSAPAYTTNAAAFGTVQINWGSPPIIHGGGGGGQDFPSVHMPPTPGNFHNLGTSGIHSLGNPMDMMHNSNRTNLLMNINGGNPLTNPAGVPINPLIANNNSMNTNITLRNPLGVANGTSIGSSHNTAHLDPNPERVLATAPGMNSSHVPYSNYESIMSRLGHFQNSMSYGQASRMSSAGYVDREREMYQQFGREKFHLDDDDDDDGNTLGFSEPDESQEIIGEQQQQQQQQIGGVNGFGEGFDDIRQEEFEKEVVIQDDNDVVDVDAFQDEVSVQTYPPLQSQSATFLAATTDTLTTGAPSRQGSRRTLSLKEWMELHKPRDCAASSPKHKVYIEKVTHLSYAIVTEIMKGLQRKQNRQQGGGGTDGAFDLNEDWEPRVSDIAMEKISVTECVVDDTAGGMKIEDIDFDVIANFDWDDSLWDENLNEDVGLLRAMGKLMYVLYMQGEDFPVGAVEKKQRPVRERADSKDSNNDILEVLRILADNEETGNETENEEENDLLFYKLRAAALPLPLCRLMCDIFKQPGGSSIMTMVDLWSELEQMTELPKAFLHGTVTSRWELVFGNNQMFGRKKEMDQLMDAASRVEQDDVKKEALLITGHAGAGKSRLVQEIRKPLKARGWTFLRCKFEKLIQSEPLSVVALGLDEFFMSTMPCFPNTDSFSPIDTDTGVECTCSKPSCPRKVIQELNSLLGLDGMKTLCRWMPGLKRLVKESYPVHADYLDDVVDHQLSEQAIQELIRLLGSLLDVVASACPVLFFVDDVSIFV